MAAASIASPPYRAPAPAGALRRAGGVRLALLCALALAIAAPVLGVLLHVLTPGQGWLAGLAPRTFVDYATNTVLLAAGVAVLAGGAGAGAAWLVTMYRFPGRGLLSWALVLPLAMPAYVLAYAYTDFFQVTGPLQAWLRAVTGTGVQDWQLPEIHSLPGAVMVLSAVLYPYVYVLARAAFLEQSQCALEVSRTLGCSPVGSFTRVGLPMARPAIASGIAFAVVESVADFGAVSFFGVPTLTTGVYRAWYAVGSPGLAAQLASFLLIFVFAVVSLERLSRGRASFAPSTIHTTGKSGRRLGPVAGLGATLACALPLVVGFLLPTAILVGMALGAEHGLGLARLATVTGHTLVLGLVASLVIVSLGAAVLAARRRGDGRWPRVLLRLATLGYAVPGAVIGVGIVVTVGSLDGAIDGVAGWFGWSAGLVLGGSVLALVYGYVARFFAVGFGPLEAGAARIAPALGEAARTLGCRGRALGRRLYGPLLRASGASALLLVLVEVMKELPATLILRPFDFDTLAVEAYRLATTERLAEAALPALVIVVAGLVPVILLCRLLARGPADRVTA